MPRTTTHYFTDTLEVFPGGNQSTLGEITYTLGYTFTPGYPDTRDEPGWGPEGEIQTITLGRWAVQLELPGWLEAEILACVSDATLIERALEELE